MSLKLDLEPAILKWQAEKRRRLTYEELAEMIGVSVATLYRMKAGRVKRLDLETLGRLCEVLECDIEDLLEYEPAGVGD